MFGSKPLSEPALPYCQLDTKKYISVKCYLKYKSFLPRECTWGYMVWEMAAILSWPQCVNAPPPPPPPPPPHTHTHTPHHTTPTTTTTTYPHTHIPTLSEMFPAPGSSFRISDLIKNSFYYQIHIHNEYVLQGCRRLVYESYDRFSASNIFGGAACRTFV